MSHFYTDVDHFALLPAIILALFGCAIFLFDKINTDLAPLIFPHAFKK